MAEIYIVKGNTGDGSDYREWIVCAYKSKKMAKRRIIELEAIMNYFGVVANAEWDVRNAGEKLMRKNKRGDKKFSTCYTGTYYEYERAQLKGDNES